MKHSFSLSKCLNEHLFDKMQTGLIVQGPNLWVLRPAKKLMFSGFEVAPIEKAVPHFTEMLLLKKVSR